MYIQIAIINTINIEKHLRSPICWFFRLRISNVKFVYTCFVVCYFLNACVISLIYISLTYNLDQIVLALSFLSIGIRYLVQLQRDAFVTMWLRLVLEVRVTYWSSGYS